MSDTIHLPPMKASVCPGKLIGYEVWNKNSGEKVRGETFPVPVHNYMNPRVLEVLAGTQGTAAWNGFDKYTGSLAGLARYCRLGNGGNTPNPYNAQTLVSAQLQWVDHNAASSQVSGTPGGFMTNDVRYNYTWTFMENPDPVEDDGITTFQRPRSKWRISHQHPYVPEATVAGLDINEIGWSNVTTGAVNSRITLPTPIHLNPFEYLITVYEIEGILPDMREFNFFDLGIRTNDPRNGPSGFPQDMGDWRVRSRYYPTDMVVLPVGNPRGATASGLWNPSTKRYSSGGRWYRCRVNINENTADSMVSPDQLKVNGDGIERSDDATRLWEDCGDTPPVQSGRYRFSGAFTYEGNNTAWANPVAGIMWVNAWGVLRGHNGTSGSGYNLGGWYWSTFASGGSGTGDVVGQGRSSGYYIYSLHPGHIITHYAGDYISAGGGASLLDIPGLPAVGDGYMGLCIPLKANDLTRSNYGEIKKTFETSQHNDGQSFNALNLGGFIFCFNQRFIATPNFSFNISYTLLYDLISLIS